MTVEELQNLIDDKYTLLEREGHGWRKVNKNRKCSRCNKKISAVELLAIKLGLGE